MIIKEKKGFTLIELLAVIVILAVIVLIASSSVGGAMIKARKNALAIEGNELVNAAKSAYQMAVLDGTIGSGTACFPVTFLKSQNYFEKGKDEGYSGSVLVRPTTAGGVEYKFWIGNGSYKIENADPGANGTEATEMNSSQSASVNCGAAKGLTLYGVDASGKVTTTNVPA